MVSIYRVTRTEINADIYRIILIKRLSLYNHLIFLLILELLEAHYDRPPTTTVFRQPTADAEHIEHLYDEIPLQFTTFADKCNTLK